MVFGVVGMSFVCVGDVGGGTGSISVVLGVGRLTADSSRSPINLSLGRSSMISGAWTSLYSSVASEPARFNKTSHHD